MASYCQRCNQQVHSTAEHQPHVCADIAKRLQRRLRQVSAVEDILHHAFPGALGEDETTLLAQDIVQKLSQMGVTDD